MLRVESITCWSCTRRLVSRLRLRSPTLCRGITQSFLRKKGEAEAAWNLMSQDVRDGKRKSMLAILEERGYVDSIAGKRDDLDEFMTGTRIGAYVGIDPTASSIHIGNLVPLMALFWLYVNGYRAVSLLGGATVKVGDPSGRLSGRPKEEAHIRTAKMANMHFQLKKLWANAELHARTHGYHWEWAWRRELVNNNAWLNKLSIVDFLRDLGPGVRLATMLGRETVRQRMKGGEGMSYAEFSYPLLQAWDWWHMFHTKGVHLQIGGADQYGNLVAGVESVKYLTKHHSDPEVIAKYEREPQLQPYGLTVPLLTTSAGEKFGKSAGNAVWLSAELTSVFDLYQFFLRAADADVTRYLKLFTFLSLPQIDSIVVEHERNQSLRKAQHVLAREVVGLVHGEAEAKKAEMQHRSVFRRAAPNAADRPGSEFDAPDSLTPATSSNTPTANMILPASLVYNQSPSRLLYVAGLVGSRSEGQRLVDARGAYIGSRPGRSGQMTDEVTFINLKGWKPQETEERLVDGKLLILRAGKWKVRVIDVVGDDEFERLGLDAPLWAEFKETRKAEAARQGLENERSSDGGPLPQAEPFTRRSLRVASTGI